MTSWSQLTRQQPPSGIPRLKRPPSRSSNANFFGAAPTPSPAPSKIPQLSSAASASSSSSRRRSTSLSSSREVELSSKISALETQLAGTKTKLDKAENQIMASQRSAKKQVDDMERKLDEANDELEFYRSQGSSSAGLGKGELDQLKKTRDALKGTVEGLMRDLEESRTEIQVLKGKASAVEELERELETLRAGSPNRQSSPGPAASVEDTDALLARISALEADLAKAQSEPAETNEEDDLEILTEMRKEIRKLKKALSLTQKMVSEAEKERDEFEEELEELKASGAVGGKKGGSDEADLVAARDALADARGRVRELEIELEGMRAANAEEKADRQAEVSTLRSEVQVGLRGVHEGVTGI